MKKKIIFTAIATMVLTFCSAPTFASTKGSLRKVDTLLKAQAGVNADLIRDLSEADLQKEIEMTLHEPLTVEGAVKIAILNNPSVEAAMDSLGISQADLLQAGLLHNPKVSGFVRESKGADSKTNTEFEVRQDVMDLLLWPLRKRLANTQFKQAEYELAEVIVDFIKEVRVGFYNWQASAQMFSIRQDHFKAEEAALELAQRQKEAGNINALELRQEEGVYYQDKIDLQRSELEAITAAQQLRNLLGLTNSELQWLSQENLPDLPLGELSLNELEEKALTNRIELAIKHQEMQAFEQSLTLARFGVVPMVEGGFNWEKETDGGRLKGPAFEAEVPIFDHKQADRFRAKAQIETGKKQLEALEAQIRLEVRLAYAQLISDKAIAETYMKAVPVRQEILKQTLEHYNYMLKGVYDLLRVKQEEIDTQRDYIMALRDYWIARSELEHAVGASLSVGKSAVKIQDSSVDNMPEQVHHLGGHK